MQFVLSNHEINVVAGGQLCDCTCQHGGCYDHYIGRIQNGISECDAICSGWLCYGLPSEGTCGIAGFEGNPFETSCSDFEVPTNAWKAAGIGIGIAASCVFVCALGCLVGCAYKKK